jgi:hypothetical protein
MADSTSAALKKKARETLFKVLMTGGDFPNRRLAAYLFDHGVNTPPSGFAKRRHLGNLFEGRGHSLFVEAGTAAGDTVSYFAKRGARVISVELAPDLHRRAADRFAAYNDVEVIFGDAVEVLPAVVAQATSPPLVWLDGHFSGAGTALGDEVEPAPTLLELLGPTAPSGTTIVVDDLRLFGTEPDYPGLDDLVSTARRAFPAAGLYVSLDALVIAT